MVRDVVLRGFTFVGFGLLGQKIGDDGLLDQYIASVLLVRQDRTDRRDRPRGFSSRRESTTAFGFVLDLDDGFTCKDQLVNKSDCGCLGFVNYEAVALTALVSEEVLVRDDRFPIGEAFTVPPRDVLRDRAGFFLRQ